MIETTLDDKKAGLATRRLLGVIPAALLLIGAADYLLLDGHFGISLFLYAALLAVGVALIHLRRFASRRCVILLGLSLVASLPLVETPSFVGLLISMLGLALLALGSVRLLPGHLAALPLILMRYGIRAPFRIMEDAFRLLGLGMEMRFGGIARRLAAWVVPIAFALAFVFLFASANPLIEVALNRIDGWAALDLLDSARVIFWMMVAIVIWPLLHPKLFPRLKAGGVRITMAASVPKTGESLLFSRAAVLRSLIVFNILFAVQTVLDVTYLWGGVALPEGMNYADYAHRGAYPLIVTALLAAGFVLVSMRPGGAAEQSPLIRRLVYAWIAQNVLLCISSILRLDLYVEVYSLTEMRIAAGIWMGLVAFGLIMILSRIALRRSNGWLVAANLLALTATLYTSSWIDWSATIARFNVEHSQEMGGEGLPLDMDYMLRLGPTVLPALDIYLDRASLSRSARSFAEVERTHLRRQAVETADWRSWSFRNWRLLAYIEERSVSAATSSSDVPIR